MKHVTAPDAPARNHGNDGLRAGSDLTLEVQDVQARHAVRAHVAARAAHLLVAPGAKREFARTREDHDADFIVVARVRKCRFHFTNRERTEGVAHFRTIDRDLGDPFGLFVKDVGIVARLLPFGNAREVRRIEHGLHGESL